MEEEIPGKATRILSEEERVGKELQKEVERLKRWVERQLQSPAEKKPWWEMEEETDQQIVEEQDEMRKMDEPFGEEREKMRKEKEQGIRPSSLTKEQRKIRRKSIRRDKRWRMWVKREEEKEKKWREREEEMEQQIVEEEDEMRKMVKSFEEELGNIRKERERGIRLSDLTKEQRRVRSNILETEQRRRRRVAEGKSEIPLSSVHASMKLTSKQKRSRAYLRRTVHDRRERKQKYLDDLDDQCWQSLGNWAFRAEPDT